MKLKLLIIFVACLSSCNKQNNKVGFNPTPESIERERLGNEILLKVATKLKHEKGLIPLGFGGRTSHGVKMLDLSFQYYKPLEIEESRELLIAAVQEFAATVNAEERIHPYLKNYPFGPQNIQVTIFLRNPDGSSLKSGLRIIKSMQGILEYTLPDPENKYNSITVCEETYEEALQKIKEKKDSSTSNNFIEV